ncbi:recombinase family protein [Lutibacter flavus]|uniref:Site-specific DNA recombinase n=1 Tax=Lutibacter flavus TaxID=691689 RepID=A0A238VI02_9FLAO|nr:recombinase family protein [Lutibacter flavus]SNR33804.1 Site-specific DNA recombinase [Lutibacter flavus]
MVGIYCRISGDKEEGKDTSIEYQEERGVAFANKMKMQYEVYKDINVSGKAEIIARDEFYRFIGDIKNKKITNVFAVHQDRIERNPDTWRYFVSTLLNAGAKWYPDGIFYDLDSTTNRAMANLLSIFNEMHSDKTSDAVKVAFYRNALKGKVHGIRAYGFTKDANGYYIQEPEEIEVVKKIFKWSLEGNGAYSIAKKLNKLNIPTRFAKLGKNVVTTDASTGKKIEHKNKVWWGSTVHGILKKKLYAGIHVWNKEEIPLPHLAIISLEQYSAIQKNLTKNKRTKSGKTPIYKYLLNGIIFCAECGHMYKGKRRLSDRRNQYICSGKQAPLHVCKGSKGFNIPRFETFIIKHLFLSKDLQQYLNNIEVDTVEIDTLTFKKNELIKKIKSVEKIETKAFNYLFGDAEDDFAEDERLKAKYREAKDRVVKFKESLEHVEAQLVIQNDNNRLNRVNHVIDGFDVSSGFDAIKKAVQQLIERIDVSYKPLERNGRFLFVIKYKGFNETISFLSNLQLLNYVCIANVKQFPSDEFGLEMVEEYMPSRALFSYKLKGLIKDELDVSINDSELITFD